MVNPTRPDHTFQLDASFFADPYSIYRKLREEQPIVRVSTPGGLPIWLVTKYQDAQEVLADPRLSKDGTAFSHVLGQHAEEPGQRQRFQDSISAHMLNSDPPDHTRMRTLVSRAFSPRTIGTLRARIEAIVDELLEDMAGRRSGGDGTVDFIEAFAHPLTWTVCCELLGVNGAERESFRLWANTLLADSDVTSQERRSASSAIVHYLTGLIIQGRATPEPGLLSVILQASDESDLLNERETISMVSLLLIAAQDGTTSMLGNGMLALLRHPAQMAALRADPELVTSAVEEFLRYEAPANTATFRHTKETVTIAGVTIPKGEIVMVALGAANRDPEYFDRPDELDVTRMRNKHLAFGYGIHHCLGMALARLEGVVAFRAILKRFPSIHLAIDPARLSWRSSFISRGLDLLPIQFCSRVNGLSGEPFPNR